MVKLDNSINDKKFIQFIEFLIETYKLDGDNRIGFISISKNLGDVYFFVSSIMYAQKKINKKIIVITDSNSTCNTFIDWHNANGALIEKICISNEESDIIKNASKSIKNYFLKNYSNKILFNSVRFCNYLLHQRSLDQNLFNNLTRPKFNNFNKELYVNNIGVIPGKTIFIIPEGNFFGSLPNFFWITCIQIIKCLNFNVVINSTKNKYDFTFDDNVKFYMPPLDDVVEFANLCGYVISMRTGLSEILAAESTAKMFIFGLSENDLKKYAPDNSTSLYNARSILKIYPFIDNSDHHINEIGMPLNKNNFSWINDFYDTLNKHSQNYINNLILRDCDNKLPSIELFSKPVEIYSFKPRPNQKLYTDISWERTDNFCNILYYVKILKDKIAIYLLLEPILDYSINIALFDANSNKIIKSYNNFNYNIAFFDNKSTIDFYFKIHIINPITLCNTIFITNKLSSNKVTN